MTRPEGLDGTPRAHLPVPSHWPYGESPKAAVRYAQGIATRLSAALTHRSLRSLARDSGVSHGTISALLRGDTWPDVQTISRLEWSLGVALWPGPDLFARELRALRAEKVRRGW